MARKARQHSESGMYHIVLKGNDKLLFAEEDDYRTFLRVLERTIERDYIDVYAYCLFSETAHIVLKEGLRPCGESIKALVSAYAVRCNEKYHRSGKLFHDRYASDPIETDAELTDAVRFVHRLPLRYGGELTYPYSSYTNYTTKKGLRSDALWLLFDESTMRFREEMDIDGAATFTTGERKRTLTDEEVIAAVRRLSAHMTAREAEHIDLSSLGTLILRLREEGASVRQISRVLQIGKSAMEKAMSAAGESKP